MHTFSLSPFIKLCISDTGTQISELQKKLSSNDGYDYYRTLKSAIRASSSGKDTDHTNAILGTGASEAEIKNNTAAFRVFENKFSKSKTISPIISKARKFEFFKTGISIAFDPLFSIETKDGLSIYSAWANKSPVLTQKYGAVACYLQRQAYKNTSLANGTFYFLDLTKGIAYSEKQISNNTSAIARSDFLKIADLIQQYEDLL